MQSMRVNLLLLILFLGSLLMNAQPEFGKKKRFSPIAPAKTTLNIKPIVNDPKPINPFSDKKPFIKNEPLFAPSNNLFNEKKKPAFVIGENSDANLNDKPAFINPNADVIDQLNGLNPKPVSENFKAIRGNQDLGNFNINSKFVNIRYRDFGEVDGDQIRIYLNGKVIEEFVILNSDFQGFQINLEVGFNKIDFEALNQGALGPNTAEFQVFDDNQKLVSSNQWNLVTGFKASIMIIKD